MMEYAYNTQPNNCYRNKDFVHAICSLRQTFVFFSNVYRILMMFTYLCFQLDELDSQAAEINKTSEISNLIKDVSLMLLLI